MVAALKEILRRTRSRSIVLPLILAVLSVILFPLGSNPNSKALAASKVIAGSVSISGGGAYTGGGTVTITNTSSGSTATGSLVSGSYYIGGLSAAGSQTYRVFLSPIPGYTILSNNIYTTFSSGTSRVNFIISKNATSPGTGGGNNSGGGSSSKTQAIEGRVYYTASNVTAGVANVGITITNRSTGSTATTSTNGSGNYLFDGLVGSSYSVSMKGASGYTLISSNPQYTTITSGGKSTINFQVKKISLPTPTPTPKPSKSIKGLVYTLGSNNVTQGFAGVTVTIKNLDSSATSQQTTNSSGNFNFTGLVGTRYNVSIVGPPGYTVSSNNQTVNLPSNGQGTASFRLTKDTSSKSVTGKVYYQDSQGNSVGVSGVTVKITNTGPTGNGNTTSTTTASTGNYAFSGLAGSKYSVSITVPSGYTSTSANPLSVTLGSNGQGTASFRLTKGATPTPIRNVSVTVKAVTGGSSSSSPVSGATVTICASGANTTGGGNATCPHGTTNSSGQVTLTAGANQAVTITATKGTTLRGSTTTTLGTTAKTVQVVLATTSTSSKANLTIKALATTGTSAPISGATVSVCYVDVQPDASRCQSGSTSSTGERTVSLLTNAPVTITVSKSGFQTATQTTTMTTSNKTITISLTTLVPKVNLTVKVQSPVGFSAPLSQVGVNVCYQRPIIIGGKTIDCEVSGTGNGTQRVFKVQSNTTVEIQAFAVLEPGKNPSNVKKTVTIGSIDRTEILILPLPSNSSFNSTVKICVYSNGSVATALKDSKISITGYSTVTTDNTGCHSYTFTGGKSISVKAEAEGYAYQTKTIVLSQPSMPTQYIYLDKNTSSNTGVIYGRVKDQKGYSAANVSVTVSRDGSVITETTTNSDGYYITSKLPYGTGYSVSFKAQCFTTNTYWSLSINTGVVGLNRTLERAVNSSCQDPSGEGSTPTNPSPPSNYPDPDDSYPAPEDPGSEVPSVDPDDPYPSVTSAPTPTAKPNATSTPKPTATPKPSSTPKPTITSQVTLIPTATPVVTSTQPTPTFAPGQPTPTPMPNGLTVDVSVFLHGIGASGDTINPNPSPCQENPRDPTKCLSNQNPQRKTRNVMIQFFDETGKEAATSFGTITYNSSKGDFEGSINVKDIPDGDYTISIWSDNYLHQLVPGFKSLTTDQTRLQLPAVALITGDTTNTNSLNILDFNFIADCYSDFLPNFSCDAQEKQRADLNDDGKVNQADINLFLRDFSIQLGD